MQNQKKSLLTENDGSIHEMVAKAISTNEFEVIHAFATRELWLRLKAKSRNWLIWKS